MVRKDHFHSLVLNPRKEESSDKSFSCLLRTLASSPAVLYTTPSKMVFTEYVFNRVDVTLKYIIDKIPDPPPKIKMDPFIQKESDKIVLAEALKDKPLTMKVSSI